MCIDQENLAERGHQVRLMGDIYRSASNFYAWLGEDSGTAALTSFFPSQDILGTALVGAVISKAARIFFKPENDSTKQKTLLMMSMPIN